jgi:hypothetical protein
MIFASNPSSGSGDQKLVFRDFSNALDRMAIDPNGLVGVGTDFPAYRLHLLSGSSGGLGIETNTSSISQMEMITTGNGTLPLNNASTKGWAMWAYGSSFANPSFQNDLRFSYFNGTGQSDVLYLDNTSNVGIGTITPGFKLDINGTANMTGFRLPVSPGNGFVLTSDASGNGTWQPGQPKIAFNAGMQAVANQSIPASTSAIVSFGAGNDFFNDGGAYNTGTYKFTPPSAGVYQMSTYVSITGTAGATLQVWINAPGSWAARTVVTIPNTGNIVVSLTSTVNSSITPGPYWVEVFSTSAIQVQPYESLFSGFRIY